MKKEIINNNIFISRILEDIVIEKQQPKPDKFFIQQSQSLLSEDTLDFKCFIDTGRITPRTDFSFIYPKVKLVLVILILRRRLNMQPKTLTLL